MEETNRTESRAQKHPLLTSTLDLWQNCQHRSVCGGKSQTDFSINAPGDVSSHEYQEVWIWMVTGDSAAITPTGNHLNVRQKWNRFLKLWHSQTMKHYTLVKMDIWWLQGTRWIHFMDIMVGKRASKIRRKLYWNNLIPNPRKNAKDRLRHFLTCKVSTHTSHIPSLKKLLENVLLQT